jgi:peroxiredoxin/dTDP-4-amino-4,6-dideoxygalactose transaminase
VTGRVSCFAPLRPSAVLMRRARELPYPLEDPRCRLYELGRTALAQGLASMGLGEGDGVLAPAYHHGSEIATLAEAGISCRFYEAGERLEPDAAELESLIDERTRALLVIHYLGFGQDAARWRRWCDERGLLLIEDVAMAWLAERDGRPLGSWGQIAFYSPWKTYGLTEDCGALICERPPATAPAPAGVPLARLLRSMAKWLAQRWGFLARLRPAGRGGAGFDAGGEFVVGDHDAPPSRSSLFLLRRLSRIDAAGRRRRNYGRLLELLAGAVRVPAPFDHLQPGSCPFALPIETADKQGLIRHLDRHGVRALDLWAVPHPLLPVSRFPGAAARRETTVALPVHQELRPADLERIAAAVIEFEREARHGPVDAGDVAPDVELLDQDGKPTRLSGFRGRPVVLYFYPEADTPGCTAQACAIRDRRPQLSGGSEAVVLGVSPDPVPKLRSFADNHGLPFTLLSDPGGRTAQRYGVWIRRPGLLPRHENERTTFVIGPDQVVLRVFRAVDPGLHDGLVASELERRLGAAA